MKLVALIFIAATAWYVYAMVRDYNATTWDYNDPKQDHLWERLLMTARGSATKLWMRLVGLVSSLAAVLVTYAPFLDSDAVQNAITTYMKPQYVAGVLLVTAMIGEMARNRTLE